MGKTMEDEWWERIKLRRRAILGPLLPLTELVERDLVPLSDAPIEVLDRETGERVHMRISQDTLTGELFGRDRFGRLRRLRLTPYGYVAEQGPY